MFIREEIPSVSLKAGFAADASPVRIAEARSSEGRDNVTAPCAAGSPVVGTARGQASALASGLAVPCVAVPSARPEVAASKPRIPTPPRVLDGFTVDYSKLRLEGGREADHAMAREAYRRAATWYAQRGIPCDAEVRIQFRDAAMVPMVNPDGSSGKPERVYGFYNNETDIITMSSWGTKYMNSRKMFVTLPINQEQHTAVLTHEITHKMFYATNPHARNLSRAVHEFVGYSVQLMTMEPAERERVQKLWRGETFTGESSINPMVWGNNPHRFGVLSYRFFNEELFKSFYKGYDPDPWKHVF